MGWVAGGATESALYRLREAFEAVLGRPQTRVVMLRGGSGSGRTGLVQAFYEYAATRQDGAEYWPSSLVDAGDPVGGREAIIPAEFTVAEGAWLPWLWLGLSGRDGDVVLAADRQLGRHAAEFGRVVKDLDGLTRRRIAYAIESAFLLGGLASVVSSVVQPVAMAMGTAGLVWDAAGLVWDAAGLVREAPSVFGSPRSRLAEALQTDGRRRFSPREEARGTAEHDGRVLAVLTRFVPLVVVIDDAEGLDEMLLELLEGLVLSSEARVMVVITVNTDFHDADPSTSCEPPGGETGAGYQNARLHRFTSRLDSYGRLEVINLAAFCDEDMVQVCRSALAGRVDGLIDPAQESVSPGPLARVLSVADGAPGRVVTLLDHRAVRQALTGGGSLPKDLASLTLRTAHEEAWSRLSDRARTALAILAVHGGYTLGRFLDVATAETAMSTGWVTVTRSGMAGAGNDDILEFRAPALYGTASSRIDSQLTAEDVAATAGRIRDGLLGIAEADSWPMVPVDVAVSLLHRLVDTDPDIPDRLSAAALRLDRATGRQARMNERAERIADRANLTGELLLATAEALADVGHTRRAVDLFTTELAKYGVGDPRMLPAMHNLAAAWAAFAREQPPAEAEPAYEKAFGLYQRVIDGYARRARLGHPTRRPPDTRIELARLYDHVGRYRDAADSAAPAVDEYTDLFGPDHLDTLNARFHLANLRGQAGYAKAAICGLAELLPICARVLGPEHPDTLTVRANLAGLRGQAGDPDRAVSELAELLPIRARVLGPEHPDTLVARASLAGRRGQAGDAKGAADALDELLPILERVLGPDHPDTLAARHNLAHWRGEAWDAKATLREFKRLVPIMVRVHGPDHPETLVARANLAVWRGYAGDPDAAACELAELLRIYEGVLGPDHPDTLTVRHNLAYWRGQAEDPST